MPDFDEEKQKKRLEELRHLEEEELVQSMAGKLGIPYIDLAGISIETDALRVIDEQEARKAELASFRIIGKQLHIAARSPLRDDVQKVIKNLEEKDYTVTLYMTSSQSLNKAWLRYEDVSMASTSRGSFLDISESSLKKITEQVKSNDDVKKLFEEVSEGTTSHRVSRLIEIIFASAIALKASDIHIEPQEEKVRLRFREDGVLHDILFFEEETYRMINSRIKLLSQLMITQTKNAQDGRFTIDYEGKQIEIRTSVIPGGYGESIVMRILNPDGINVGLEQLGIEPKLLSILLEEIEKPNGLILTTGPTGSGKTTTLYSFLKKVYTPEIKILTIEDPIEYHLEGITQTQVDHDKGYDFLSGLRAALRQDPDVVMVGEIRDKETASIAVNASLTGHLVLSTLHTNNAAGAIPRLLDLGVNPGILSAALSVSIAQRLIRKLCDNCKTKRTPTAEEEKLLRTILEQAHALGKDLSSYHIQVDQPIELYQPVGCDQCGHFGYKGRLGVYEAILNDHSIQEILEKHPSEREVKIIASHQGILTMKEDGVLKILSGITSIEEVRGVVDLNEDLELFEEMMSGVPTQKDASQESALAKNASLAPQKITAEIMSHENNNTTDKGRELQLLIDYLKMLEQEQETHPQLGIAKQIQSVQQTILSLLKEHGVSVLFQKAQSEEEKIAHEINALMHQLKTLQYHQMITPDVGVAEKLRTIRSSLQNLSPTL